MVLDVEPAGDRHPAIAADGEPQIIDIELGSHPRQPLIQHQHGEKIVPSPIAD